MAPSLAAAAAAILALLLPAGAPLAAEEEDWQPAGEHRDVTLEFRPTPDGYRAYRGRVTVCTDLDGLQQFVADGSRLEEWIPYTEEARALPEQEPEQEAEEGRRPRYYLRSGAPWPFQSRDMVYELVPRPMEPDQPIRIDVKGLPEAVPERRDAVRMTAAEGRWTLEPGADRIRVSFRLALNPGRVPSFFANRRLRATVAGALANLAERFTCGS